MIARTVHGPVLSVYVPTPEQISFAVESLLYGQPLAYDQLPRVVDAALAAGAREIKAKLLLVANRFPKVSKYSADSVRGSYKELHGRDDSVVGEVRGRFGRGSDDVVSGRFVAARHPLFPLVWIVVTDAGTDFLKRPFRYFLRSLEPKATAPIFRTSQIEALLRLIHARPNVRSFRVTQLGFRSRIRSEGARKAVERDRKWTDLSLEEAFSEAIESGQWVTDASAEYEFEPGSFGFLKVHRNGVFTFERHAHMAMRLVIDRAARMAADWYEFLRDRDRAAKTSYHSRPFAIEFGHPALESVEQIRLLAGALSNIPSVTCTVLHGNPYFHAVLVDYHDGSTYEVLVLTDSRLTVIPQGRTTVRALRRLCAQVFAEFREGELKEAAGA